MSNPGIVDLQCYARCRRVPFFGYLVYMAKGSSNLVPRVPPQTRFLDALFTLPCVRCDDRKRKMARKDMVLVRTQDRLLCLSLVYPCSGIMGISAYTSQEEKDPPGANERHGYTVKKKKKASWRNLEHTSSYSWVFLRSQI